MPIRIGRAAQGWLLLAGIVLVATAAARDLPPTYDVIIEHGRVVDGTGAPWYAADVGIRAGRIAAIGRLSLPASRLRLNDRGVLKAGMWADIVVFDPEAITDRATFSAPNQLSVGMQWVLVNGAPVVAEGKLTQSLPGQVLRGNRRTSDASR
jgi:N-acyl-D-aspartate/D-glutamate deacylase